MITKNKMVSVSYELRTEQNGELLEAAGADRPLDFICGQGQTLEYFEMNLLDKNEGDKFDFSIPAAHAYGLVNEDMIVDLPQEIFKDVEAEEMVVGHVLPMMDSVGRRLQGKILSIGDEEVRIDFNHPLAGKDLFFKGEILGVRDATDEELEATIQYQNSAGNAYVGMKNWKLYIRINAGGVVAVVLKEVADPTTRAADAEDVTKYIRNTFYFLCPVIL